MKRKKVALYNPFLDVMGGGEKHILSILKVIQDNGYEAFIFWDDDLSESFEQKLNLHFSEKIQFLPNIFPQASIIDKAKRLNDFDIFLYVTNGSYFYSSAKKNIIFAMVPDKKLYDTSIITRLKLLNSQFISNSHYTQKWLQRWGTKSDVIYPYIDEEYIKIDVTALKKEKIILSAGRFFKHLHSKRQDIMVETFKKLKKELPKLKDYKLVLAGSVKEEDKEYFEMVKTMVHDDKSILLKPNISHKQLSELYKSSQIYWHFAGYDVDENKNPDAVEHLGITPLEAMANGCIVLAYNAGGLKETVKDGKTGYLFSDINELKEKLSTVLSNKKDNKALISQAQQFVKDTFSYDVFKQRVNEVILK